MIEGVGFFNSDKYRTTRRPYSNEIIRVIDDLFADKTPVNVAEIGAGDGRFTDILFKSNINIKQLSIVEPDPIANKRHKDRFSLLPLPYPVTYIEAPSHNTALLNNNIDIIFAAQAFHWFDIETTRPEFLRIMKPNGAVFIFGRFLDECDPTTAEYVNLTRFGRRHKNVRSNLDLYSEDIMNKFYGHRVERHTVSTERFDYSLDNLLNEMVIRIDSSGDNDLKNNAEKQDFIFKNIKDFFNRYQRNGLITLQHFSFYYCDKIQ